MNERDPRDDDPRHAAARAELERWAAHAGEDLERARSEVREGDVELVRSALHRAARVHPAHRSSSRARWPWLALAAAALVAALLLWQRASTTEPPERRRWLSAPDWVALVERDPHTTVLRFERELALGARYHIRVYAGADGTLVCDEPVDGREWTLSSAARGALDEHGQIEILLEVLVDSGAAGPAPLRFTLSSR
ncbi:MAG: hypothetical protein IT454_03660 [Planctomycetes bacterium]|nr:hypothetical protein [Planctomycetota bacterium]